MIGKIRLLITALNYVLIIIAALTKIRELHTAHRATSMPMPVHMPDAPARGNYYGGVTVQQPEIKRLPQNMNGGL